MTEERSIVSMIAVVQEIHDGGRDLIPNWSLLRHAKRAVRRGGAEELRHYVETLIQVPNERALWVRTTLEAHKRRTLESEYPRFLAAYRGEVV